MKKHTLQPQGLVGLIAVLLIVLLLVVPPHVGEITGYLVGQIKLYETSNQSYSGAYAGIGLNETRNATTHSSSYSIPGTSFVNIVNATSSGPYGSNGLLILASSTVNFTGNFTAQTSSCCYITWRLHVIYSNGSTSLVCVVGNDNTGGTNLNGGSTPKVYSATCTSPASNLTLASGDKLRVQINAYDTQSSARTVTHYWDGSFESAVNFTGDAIGALSISTTSPASDTSADLNNTFSLTCATSCTGGDCLSSVVTAQYKNSSGSFASVGSTGELVLNGSETNPHSIGEVDNGSSTSTTFIIKANNDSVNNQVRCYVTANYTADATSPTRNVTVNKIISIAPASQGVSANVGASVNASLNVTLNNNAADVTVSSNDSTCVLNQTSFTNLAGTKALTATCTPPYSQTSNYTVAITGSSTASNYNVTQNGSISVNIVQPVLSWNSSSTSPTTPVGSSTNTTNKIQAASLNAQNVTINILNCPSGWTCTASPSSISTLTTASSQTINATLTLPYNEMATQRNISINANDSAGRSAGNWTVITSITQPVLSVQSAANLTVIAGGTNSTTLNVSNTGSVNAQNVVMGHDCPVGWTCAFNSSNFTLAAGATATVQFNATAPSGASGNNLVTLNATDSAGRTANSNISLDVPGAINISVSPESQTITTAAGVAANVSLNVTVASGTANVTLSTSDSSCVLNQTSWTNLASTAELYATCTPAYSQTGNYSVNVNASSSTPSTSVIQNATISITVTQPVLSWNASTTTSTTPVGATTNSTNTVQASNADAQNVTIGILDCPSGWTCNTSPSSITTLSTGSPQTVNFSITVPYSESALQKTLVVNATDAASRSAGNWTVTVNVSQPSLSVTSIANLSVQPGSSNTTTVNVTNTGSVTAQNVVMGQNCPSGFTCTFNDSNFSISAGSTVAVTFSAAAPTSMPVNTLVTINATDSAGRTANSITSIDKPPATIITVAPASQTISTTAGSSADASLNLTTSGGSANVTLTSSDSSCTLNQTSFNNLQGTVALAASCAPAYNQTSNYTVQVNATSTTTNTEVTQNATISVTVTQPALSWNTSSTAPTTPTGTATNTTNTLQATNADAQNVTIGILSCPTGWTCAIAPSSISTLTTANAQTITATLTVPYNETATQRTITINATDAAGRNAGDWMITANITQPTFVVQMETNMSVTPASSNTTVINVTNTGSVSAQNLVMGENCPSGWTCMFNNTNFTLNAGSTAAVLFNATAPSGTPAHVTVTVNASDSAGRTTNSTIFLDKPPTIEIALSPASQTPSIGAGSSGNVSLNLTTTEGTANVMLSSSNSTCVLNQTSFNNLAGTAELYATCSPPYDQTSNYAVQVNATSSTPNTDVTQNATITINVLQPALSWNSSSTSQTTPVGTATNASNFLQVSSANAQNITIGITNCPAGWTCNAMPNSLSTLETSNPQNVAIQLTVPYNETGTQYNITINATDSAGRTAGNWLLTSDTAQPALQIQTVSNLSVSEGSSNTTIINVSNTGTVNALGVTLAQNCQSPFTCTFNETSVSITAGDTKAVELNVSVSVGTAAQSNLVTINATDNAGRNNSTSLSIDVLASPNFTATPMTDSFSVPDDSSQNRDYTLNNTGNANLGAFSCTANESWVSFSSCPSAISVGASANATAEFNATGQQSGEHAVLLTFSSNGATNRTVLVNVNIINGARNVTLQPSSSTLSVPAGGSGSAELNVTASPGAANVTLSSSSVLCTLNQTSFTNLQGTAPILATCNPPYNQTTNFTVQINASSDTPNTTVIQNSTISVDVLQPALSISSPTNITVPDGSSRTAVINVSNSGTATAQNVSIAENCPAAYSCTFNDSNFEVPAGGTRTVLFNATSISNAPAHSIVTLNASDPAARGATTTISLDAPATINISPASQAVSVQSDDSIDAQLTVNVSTSQANVTLSSSDPKCTLNQTIFTNLQGTAPVTATCTPGYNQTTNFTAQINATTSTTDAIVTQNATIEVQIVQPTLSWSSSVTNQTLQVGTSTNNTNDLQSSDANAQDITISITNCPSGWTCTATPNSGIFAPAFIPQMITITLAVPSTETGGERNITITANDSAGRSAGNWTLTTDIPAPTITLQPASQNVSVQVDDSVDALLTINVTQAQANVTLDSSTPKCVLNQSSLNDLFGAAQVLVTCTPGYSQTSNITALINASSITQNAIVTQNASIFVEVQQPELGWSSSQTTIEVPAGNNASGTNDVTSSVANAQNVNISILNCPTSWTCAVTPQQIGSLPAFIPQTITASISAPANETLGTHNNTITAADEANRSAGNWTLSVNVTDTIPPAVSLIEPTNTTYYVAAGIPLNFTATDYHLQSCYYSLNGGSNVLLAGCANTTINPPAGTNTLAIFANDSSGNANSSSVVFTTIYNTTLSINDSKDPVEDNEQTLIYANYNYANGTPVTGALCQFWSSCAPGQPECPSNPAGNGLHTGIFPFRDGGPDDDDHIYGSSFRRWDVNTTPALPGQMPMWFFAVKKKGVPAGDLAIYTRCDGNHTPDGAHLIATIPQQNISASDYDYPIINIPESLLVSNDCSLLIGSPNSTDANNSYAMEQSTMPASDGQHTYSSTDNGNSWSSAAPYEDETEFMAIQNPQNLTFNITTGRYETVPRKHQHFSYTFDYNVTCTSPNLLSQTAFDSLTIVDLLPPLVSIDQISPNPAVLGVTNVTVYWTANDRALTNSYANVTTPNGTFLAQYGSSPFTINGSAFDVVGNYTVTVWAKDKTNLTTNASTQFEVIALVPPPIISNESANVTGTSTAQISWLTDKNATSIVHYGTTAANLTQNKTNSTLDTNHAIDLTGLSSSTTYFYKVESCDSLDLCNSSTVNNFTTQSSGSGGGGGGGGSGGSGGGGSGATSGSITTSEPTQSTSTSSTPTTTPTATLPPAQIIPPTQTFQNDFAELQVLDTAGSVIPFERCIIKTPTGQVFNVQADEHGRIRFLAEERGVYTVQSLEHNATATFRVYTAGEAISSQSKTVPPSLAANGTQPQPITAATLSNNSMLIAGGMIAALIAIAVLTRLFGARLRKRKDENDKKNAR